MIMISWMDGTSFRTSMFPTRDDADDFIRSLRSEDVSFIVTEEGA